MDGANLYSVCMEVALEQWTERTRQYMVLIGSNGFSHRYRGSSINGFMPAYWQSVDIFLNLGGTADNPS